MQSVPESGEVIPLRGDLALNFVTQDCQQILLQHFSTWGDRYCEVPSELGASAAPGPALRGAAVFVWAASAGIANFQW